MLTLTYGYKKPEDGDKGAALFDALEGDIQQLNDHSHDGIDSATIDRQSLEGMTQSITSAGWVTYGGPTGHYRQQVTVIAGFDFDTVTLSFRTSAGAYMYPTVERVSDTQFFIYSIDNTLNITAVYGG